MATSSKSSTKTEGSAGDMSAFEEALDQGFLGEKVDPLPNEAYTVEGVSSGKAAEQDRKAATTPPPDEG